MRKPRKRSFQELVAENKLQLLRDREAIEKLEERLEERLGKKLLKEVR
ncbi:FbpB family small basic protein [Niallia sp. 03133]